MAGATTPGQVLPPGPRESWQGPLGAFGWLIAWADYVVYKIEFAAVVAAMIVMTIIEFIYILSIYVTEQKINIAKLNNPALEAELPWGFLILLGFMGLLMGAVVNNTRLGRKADGVLRPLPLRIVSSLGLLVFAALLSWGTVWFEQSSTFYIILVGLIMIPAAAWFFQRGERLVAGGLGVATLAAWGATTIIPTGYSWADNFALFLLLWVGFLGASMASKQGRHLRVDAARKLWPKAWQARLLGVSLLVSAAFSGLICYVGGIYLFHEDYGRYWANSLPGEIPSWIVALAIPFSFLLITLRMGGRGLVRLLWGERYVTTSEEDTGEVAAAGAAPLELPDASTTSREGDT